MRINSKKNNTLNLNSMRLGINSIIALSGLLQQRPYDSINLADNSISDYGMHAVKSIINNKNVRHVNLSSNMISEVGLEMIVDDLTRNMTLKTLDLGILEGSIRKNSLGM